jgi:putative ABC transport system permease protein
MLASAVLHLPFMSHDLRVAVRSLIQRPGFALSVVLTLALGIGASTMMFSLVNAAFLRPLPFKSPERLTMLWGVAGPERDIRGGSFPEVRDWRAMNRTFSDVSSYDETSLNMMLRTEAVRVDTEMVSAGFFELLGARPALGRTFAADDDAAPGARPVAIISDALWRERFDASPEVLQQTITLNEVKCAIVGVMPRGFAGLSFDTDVWVPSIMVTVTSSPAVVTNRGNRWLGAVGRLRDGVSMAQAQDDLTRVAAQLEQQYPDTNRQRGVLLIPLKDALLGRTAPLITALFGGVLLFLLVSCANVASLQLARTTARRRELAVRAALGARQWHVLRQLLVESFVLAAAAGILGAIVAAWGTTAVIALTPDGALPRHVVPSVDPRVLIFTSAITCAVAVLVAVLPVAASRGRDLADALRTGGRTSAAGIGSLRRPSAQQLLIVAEIALAMTLLTAGGLMGRSLLRQMDVRVGFDPNGVTTARLDLPIQRYSPEQNRAFVSRLGDELRRRPLVRDVTLGSGLPFTGNVNAASLRSDRDPETAVRYFRHVVTKDFLSTLGIPLLRGRAFSDHDGPNSPLVAIVSESGARRIWRGEDPVGRRFRTGGAQGPEVEVVGMVADARFRSLVVDLSAAGAEPDLFFPYGQRTEGDLEIAVRSADGAPIPLASVQAAVAAVDPSIPVYRVQPLGDAVAAQTASARFGAVLLGAFSLGALLLAGIGLYGLVAYIVGLSRREIAVRLALGATGRGVVALIVRNGLVLVTGGLLIGAVGAVAAGRALETQLFQTTAIDPGTYATVAATLLLVALLASALPARRAVRVDPHAALRAD